MKNESTRKFVPDSDEDPCERQLARLYLELGAAGIVEIVGRLRELIVRNNWLEKTHATSMFVIQEFCARGEIIADMEATFEADLAEAVRNNVTLCETELRKVTARAEAAENDLDRALILISELSK